MPDRPSLPPDLQSGDFLASMSDEAYRLSDHHVQYKDCFFGFLDILGYKAKIELLGDQAPLEIFRIVRDVYLSNRTLYSSIRLKILSDSILVWSASNSPVNFWTVLNVIELLRSAFFKNGILIRGGLAEGKNFIHQDIIVSPALIKAYAIEQSAKFPRIVLEENAVRIGTSSLVSGGGRVGILIDGHFRICSPEKVEVDPDGKQILSVFANDENLRTIQTNIPSWYIHGDALPTIAQIEACKSAGIENLIEARRILETLRPIGQSVSIKEKFNYLVSKFNETRTRFRIDQTAAIDLVSD